MNPHRILFFDHSASNGPEPLIWESANVPNSAGINDVVQLITQFRSFVRRKRSELKREITRLAAVSDENLGHLIRMAYRASFQTDEGRSIRTRITVSCEEREKWRKDCADKLTLEEAALIVAHYALVRPLIELSEQLEETRHHTYRFREPQRLEDHKLLVKLAPLLPERDGVITVRECEERLCVTGMGLLDQDDSDRQLLDMPGIWQPSGGLLIEILGPGNLRVVEGKADFVLAADELVTRRRILHVAPVEQWLAELTRRWVAEFQTDPVYSPQVPHFQPFEGLDVDELYPRQDVQVAVARMLRSAISLGHGGAFAILPDPNISPITLTSPIEPVDLGLELRQTWRAHCQIWHSAQDTVAGHTDAAERKRVAVNRWMSRLTSIGRLTAADGYVVLDRGLVLHGFGGFIDMNPSGFHLETCYDLISGTEVSAEALLKPFGTRHKAAFALCRKVPGAILFIISQDGDLRMFASDAESRVTFAPNLSV